MSFLTHSNLLVSGSKHIPQLDLIEKNLEARLDSTTVLLKEAVIYPELFEAHVVQLKEGMSETLRDLAVLG